MASESAKRRATAGDRATVFEASPDGILVVDTESGAVVDANEAAVEWFGRSREHLCEQSLEALCRGSADARAVLERAAGGTSVTQEWKLAGVDGTRWVEVSVTRADDGHVLVFLRSRDEGERNEHLKTVIEHLPVVLFALNPEGVFTLSRGRGLERLGLEPGDLDGISVFEAYSDNPEIRAACERALDGEAVRTVQEVGDSWFDTTYRPVTDENGELQHVIGVSLDVTAQKEHERRLEENDAILTQLTETTDDVFWLFDSDFSEVQFVNEAYEDIWGRSIDAVKRNPMDFMEGIHPDDREMVAGAVERLRNGESTDHEYRVNPGENYERWVWVRGEPITDEQGTVEQIAGFARDITDRKRREHDLERSERQFEAVFNDPQLLVGLLDTDGTVRRINETALEFATADREAVEGMAFPETPWWSHDETLQEQLSEWIDRAANGEYVEYEADHPLPGGREMRVEGTIRPVVAADGTVHSLIASARDVTERVERERQLEESNERLEKFAYVASHDLQEPLRTISNYIELIAEEYGDELDDEAEQFIDVVVTGSDRMQSMINGLLDYSRVTTRGDEFEPVDTEAAVADVVGDLRVMREEHGGTVNVGDLPTVDADGDQFRQVVQNLLKNALEHADSESVTIDVRGEELADRYRFEVADDGPGVEPNRQEKIFRIFKSGQQYQTSSQARGIGLAICDNIVQRHGGEIWVESDPGEGATFVFTIAKQ